jgi:hypothetical protein
MAPFGPFWHLLAPCFVAAHGNTGEMQTFGEQKFEIRFGKMGAGSMDKDDKT